VHYKLRRSTNHQPYSPIKFLKKEARRRKSSRSIDNKSETDRLQGDQAETIHTGGSLMIGTSSLPLTQAKSNNRASSRHTNWEFHVSAGRSVYDRFKYVYLDAYKVGKAMLNHKRYLITTTTMFCIRSVKDHSEKFSKDDESSLPSRCNQVYNEKRKTEKDLSTCGRKLKYCAVYIMKISSCFWTPSRPRLSFVLLMSLPKGSFLRSLRTIGTYQKVRSGRLRSR
jgi:hypothetical protein